MADPAVVDLLQHLRTFVRIAEAGNISKAAPSLGLSIAMASRHLRALEDDLGVSLMRRTTRRVDLTDEGEEMLLRARAILSGIEDARDAVKPGRGAAGSVVMSVPVSLGLAQISPLLPKLLERHPRLKLDLRFDDRSIDLIGEGVDLAVRAGAAIPDSPFIVGRRLATFERVLVASPGFLKANGAVESVGDLGKVCCLVQGAAPTRWQFETLTGPASVVVEGRVRTNNILAVRDAALAGVGVAQVPLWLVAEDLRKRRLVRVLPAAVLPVVQVFGLFHRGARSSASVRAVLDHLATELPRGVR
jgi:DNA-binding transcriptional LysR family regulator